jgi:D-alanine-D-alanine ligase
LAHKIRVGILFGGRSAEHEVSLQSAKNVVEAMDREKYEPILIGIDKQGQWYLSDQPDWVLNAHDPKLIRLNTNNNRVGIMPLPERNQLVGVNSSASYGHIDVVFPVLHGPYGEDGAIQGLLKLAGIPCVGADVLGSAIGMDKDVMKRLLRDAGIPIARFRCYRSEASAAADWPELTKELGLPLFVKPANLGSSVGVSKVRTEREYIRAVKTAFEYDRKIIVEEAIRGREIECSVLGNEQPIASLPGEVLPRQEFYSYEAKYIDEHGARLDIPARLSPAEIARVQAMALDAFQVLCCSGMARVDMFLQADGRLVLNEINTIPGFTRISMYPQLWQASGIGYSELIDRLIQLAIGRFQAEQRLRTTVD